MELGFDENERTIERIHQVLSFTPDDHPLMPLVLADLGTSYAARFRYLRELDDLQKAIEYTSIVLTLTPDDDPGLPRLLDTLALTHGQRYRCLKEGDDISQAVEYATLAFSMTPEGHPDFQRRLCSVGLTRGDRYSHSHELADLDMGIEYLSRSLSSPGGRPDLSTRLGCLVVLHSNRYDHLSLLDDNEKAIEYGYRALALTPEGHPEMSARLAALGKSYRNRFERLGDLENLEKAIAFRSHALDLTPDDDPGLPALLGELGGTYFDRFERLGDLDDIEKGLEYQYRAISLLPDGHPNLPTQLGNLALSYSKRFDRLGELDDLENAIEFESRALALTPNGQSDFPVHLANLGVSHRSRFERLGDIDDLEKAIAFESRAVHMTPDNHPHLSARLAELGGTHTSRFQRLGDLNDVEKAIEYGSRALSLTPDGHIEFSSYLINLGAAHIKRFEHLNELDDIERALECLSRAVALTPEDHPQLSGELNNLAVSHSLRFQHLGQLDDIEKAIQYGTRGLALTPDNHPGLADRLANLGMFYSFRFERLGEVADVEMAIKWGSLALTLTPKDHPDLSKRLGNLGVAQRDRFHCLGELEDLIKSGSNQSRALDLTPEGHPSGPSNHINLANSHLAHFLYTQNPAYVQLSLESFRKGCRSPTGVPRDKFAYVYRWATLASAHRGLDPIEAYQTAIDLLPQFAWLGATTNQRYQDLLKFKDLPAKAASAAILSSRISLALEWLEHARCVVWNQGLVLRSPFDHLQSSHPDVGTRLQAVANQLHRAGSESSEPRTLSFNSKSMAPELVAQEHRRLAKEYNDLLAQTRMIPGFEGFLQPMNAERLVQAARFGPIVVINCNQSYCDALVILPGKPNVDHIPLRSFSEEKAKQVRTGIETSLRRKGLRERGVKARQEPEYKNGMSDALATLWHDVAKPVLDFLGYMNDILTDEPPHVTWCPTGALSFLPLHAAGDYEQPGARIFNHVISSYTPNLTALLASTPSTLNRDSRVLAIGQTTTPGHSPLPGTARELARVNAHIHGKVDYSQLMADQATTSAVLDAMERHDWVHLACHAHQNVIDPTKSGFFLHNGTLDLAAINRRSFKGKGLAFLSACQTATGDEMLPDEAIHLASGMLMAGYSSVIATMWSVVDEDAPLVADKVYGELMKDAKVGNGEAGKALHDAVAELRSKVGEKAFDRWVPYIHIGS